MRLKSRRTHQSYRAMKSTRSFLVSYGAAELGARSYWARHSVLMMAAQEAFEAVDLGKVIDVGKVVVACHADTWSVQGFLLEQMWDAEEPVHSMVAGPAAVFRVVVGLRVEWQLVVKSAFLEVYPQAASSNLERLCFLLQSVLYQSSEWL